MFYGISRTFSTKNEAQYETIGAFWDEMSAKYGLENLQGIGYHWTEDSIEYAIGLKEGMIDDYNCGIMLPSENWHTVKGRTADLGRIYEKIYEAGRLDMEIETFTADGECEISYYRVGDDWLNEPLEVNGLIFDTAKCTAFLQPKEPEKIVLASNFMHTSNSSIHWMDEAGHGMCTHRCSAEEVAQMYELLQRSEVDQWKYTAGLRNIPVTKEVKEKVLNLIGDKVGEM